MFYQDDVINFCKSEFAFLNFEYGSSRPILKRSSWTTELYYKLGDLAIEILVDFRDLDIDLYVVRLENGKIPNGFYVSGRGICRLHLEKIIADQKWRVDNTLLKKLRSKTKREDRAQTLFFQEMIRQYHLILVTIIEKIFTLGEDVFIHNELMIFSYRLDP